MTISVHKKKESIVLEIADNGLRILSSVLEWLFEPSKKRDT